MRNADKETIAPADELHSKVHVATLPIEQRAAIPFLIAAARLRQAAALLESNVAAP
jgi:hypothetical protein